MRKKGAKQKAAQAAKVLDVFEAWLEKQKAKPVRARPGFISSER